MPKKRQLIEPSDFERMRVFQQPISIFLQGELIGENVIIQSHNEETVLSTIGEDILRQIVNPLVEIPKQWRNNKRSVCSCN